MSSVQRTVLSVCMLITYMTVSGCEGSGGSVRFKGPNGASNRNTPQKPRRKNGIVFETAYRTLKTPARKIHVTIESIAKNPNLDEGLIKFYIYNNDKGSQSVGFPWAKARFHINGSNELSIFSPSKDINDTVRTDGECETATCDTIFMLMSFYQGEAEKTEKLYYQLGFAFIKQGNTYIPDPEIESGALDYIEKLGKRGSQFYLNYDSFRKDAEKTP